jgi:hypothetical protein
VDWKTPHKATSTVKMTTQLYSKYQSHTKRLSFRKWVAKWVQNVRSWDKILLFIVILSPILIALLYLFQRNQIGRYKEILIFWIITYIGVGFWFFWAPVLRYGYGFLISNLAISIFLLCVFFEGCMTHRLRRTLTDILGTRTGLLVCSAGNYLLILFLLYSSIAPFKSYITIEMLKNNYLLPQKYVTADVVTKKINNVIFVTPSNNEKLIKENKENRFFYYNKCWNHNLPCTIINLPNHGINKKIEMRGKTLKSGFRVKN